MTHQDIETVVDSFVQGAKRAVRAGFKALELHSAHGYLMHQFLSPLSNKRNDEFGGSQENRLRFPLMVTREVRKAIPADVVLLPRVSAAEYDANGYTVQDMAKMCLTYCEAGADMIHVSSGGSVPVAPPTWPGYQLPLAQAIKKALVAAGYTAPVIGVGKLDDASLAEYALQQGYCDMVAIGRAMLKNPNWPSLAAAVLGGEPPIVTPLKTMFVPEAK
jgi:NADPH2 dehydrogenase